MELNQMIRLNRAPGQCRIGVAAFFVVCILSFALSAAAEDVSVKDLPKEAVKALYLSQQALQENKFDEVIKALTEYMAQAKEPVPLPAYQMLGHAYYQKQDREKARKTYEAAHGAFPKSEELLQNLSIITYETGHIKEAGGLFEKLYRLKGEKDKKLLYQAAQIYFQAENRNEAKRVLAELLSSGGEPDPKWYEDIIGLCVEQKQWSEAEKWALAFLDMQPERSMYWRLLAQLRLDRQQYQAAAAALEIVYRLETAKQGEWLELSDLYLYLNAPLMAIRCMKAAYGNEIPADKMLKIARNYARTMRFDEAVKTVEEAYRKKPEVSLILEKGRLLYDAGNYTEAISALRECVKSDPQQGDAWVLMGFAHWNLKKWEEARSAFVSASNFAKYRDQANDAVGVLDNMLEAMKRSTDEKL
jgi:tetratricopeptide (TPR) repeat protein